MDLEKLLDQEKVENEALEEPHFDSLTKTQELAYGVGHFLNDLTATGWINYMLIYLSNINPISPVSAAANAGAVMLGGQITDGFTTPLVGYFSDKTKTRIGKRKPWYLAGTAIVIISYIFIFEKCLFSYAFPDANQDNVRLIYYIFFGSLFNVGWAFVQVAHMALVPSLTASRIKRDRLNSFRNSFTYLANFVVLGLSLIFFTAISDPITQFRVLSYSIIVFGTLTSLFFVWKIDEVHLMQTCLKSSNSIRSFLKEKKRKSGGSSSDEHSIKENGLFNQEDPIHEENPKEEGNPKSEEYVEEYYEWYQWFKLRSFYQYGAAYIGVRITSNCLGALINFYLVYVLQISDGDLTQNTPFQLALIPLLLYFFSVMASISLERLYRRFGRKITYVIGVLCVAVASSFMMILTPQTSYFMYIFTCIFGIGQSLCLNTGIAFLSEIVGRKGSSGAFVFGFFSFWDKVLNGIILFVILNSTYMEKGSPDSAEFVRYVTCLIPFIGALIAGVLIIFGKIKDYKCSVEGKMTLEDEFAED